MSENETKYTPGPMVVRESLWEDYAIIDKAGATLGEAHSGVDFGRGIKERPAKANAQLWATAHKLVELLCKAEQLAEIASDWDLGTDGMVEIDDEWVSTLSLKKEFHDVIAEACGEVP